MKFRRPIKVELDPQHIHDLIDGTDSTSNDIEGDTRTIPQPKLQESPLAQYPGSVSPASVPFEKLPLRNMSVNKSSPNIPRVQGGEDEESTSSRLRDLLTNPPSQENYKPSTLRKIGGGIIGGLVGAAHGPKAGIEIGSSIADQPYREAYQDWATRSGALGEQAKLDIERGRVKSSGLSGYAAYIRAANAGDPEVQGAIEKAKYGAREDVQQPGRESLEDKKQQGRVALEDIRKDRETNLETNRQKGRETLSAAQIASREKIAEEQMRSRENIARMGRELRSQLAKTKTQRVPPSQQYLAGKMSENEISQLISDPAEFEALFTPIKDAAGNTTSYKLKPDNEVTAEWKTKRDARKKQIDNITNRIMGSSYKPSTEDSGESEDQFDIEEQ